MIRTYLDPLTRIIPSSFQRGLFGNINTDYVSTLGMRDTSFQSHHMIPSTSATSGVVSFLSWLYILTTTTIEIKKQLLTNAGGH